MSERMKMFVGNLPFNGTTEETIRPLFAGFGEVHDIKLINDRETGRFRGFGFIEMDKQSALDAMEALNGTQYEGRELRINEANPPGHRGGGQRDAERSGGGDRSASRGDDRGNRREPGSHNPYNDR